MRAVFNTALDTAAERFLLPDDRQGLAAKYLIVVRPASITRSDTASSRRSPSLAC
jgi:hypothetical protein